MFCAACGQPMQPFEQACSRCGRQFLAAAPAFPQPIDRVRRHLQTLGILWIVWAAKNTLGWLIALPFLTRIFSDGGSSAFGHMDAFHAFGPDLASLHMAWLPGVLTAIVLMRSALAVITGLALLRHAPWARSLALATAFLTIIKPLTGTALSIYTLWVLLPAQSSQEYEHLAGYPMPRNA